jgi:hypothetical protein
MTVECLQFLKNVAIGGKILIRESKVYRRFLSALTIFKENFKGCHHQIT